MDHDGDIEIVLFNNQQAPAGLEKILRENHLGNYVLYVPRITIYKWENNGFIKFAVKYYSDYEGLPNGLIRDALLKIYQKKSSGK